MFLVTGGAGFIGSNFLHYLKKYTGVDDQVIIIDNLSYAADKQETAGKSILGAGSPHMRSRTLKYLWTK